MAKKKQTHCEPNAEEKAGFIKNIVSLAPFRALHRKTNQEKMTQIEPFEIPSVIFCSIQRSGSTMMVDDFSVLNGRTRFETHENFCRMIDQGVFQDNAWPQIEEKLKAQIQSEREGLFIENIMYDHANIVSEKLSPELHDEVSTPFYQFFKNAVWVKVVRADIIEQAISKYFAATTNIWDKRHVSSGDYNHEVPYDFEKLLEYSNWINQCRQSWDRFFEAHQITPIEIFYEHAQYTFPDYLKPVFEAANLPFPEDIAPRRTQKLGNRRNIEFKKRFIEDLVARVPIG